MTDSLIQALRRVRATAARAPALSATLERALSSAGLLRTPHGVRPRPDIPPPPSDPTVLARRHVGAQGQRDYKLYVPPGDASKPRPLIVMLHGCKQDPDDFAAGTRMNAHARREGFLVAYPAQTQRANGANCWNWFETAQQARDGVEPSLIAGIVRDIAAAHAVDERRVYVAGLSAGASMALILADAYPELFAGVAVHSGLPLGAAHDVQTAFAAMRGQGVAARPLANGVRAIVFHGDADPTVVAANGDAVVAQVVQAHRDAGRALTAHRFLHGDGEGRARTATVYRDPSGQARVESWRVHGGAHAWFGGSPQGSYTEAGGPDASAEIVRFFLHDEAKAA